MLYVPVREDRLSDCGSTEKPVQLQYRIIIMRLFLKKWMNDEGTENSINYLISNKIISIPDGFPDGE